MTSERRALEAVLVECLALRAGEELLVLTDPSRRVVARALADAGGDMGAEAVLMEMAERTSHGIEPPAGVAAALLACDVFLAPTTKSLSHTEARVAACAAGARGATMPGITKEVLVRTMNADYGRIRERSRALAALLSEASEVHITSEEGTDVTLSLEGRAAMSDDGDLTRRGAFGNLPAGEAFAAPVEGSANGRIVFDGSGPAFGGSLIATIVDGYAASFGGPAAPSFRALIEPHGHEALAVAEFGIGTNDHARVTGELLEDEKVLGTVHLAFGDNHSFGGAVRVDFHLDQVILHPEVSLDGRVVLSAGRLRT